MDWTWYLFKFNGRINRARFWLAGLIILGWMFAIGGAVLAAGLAVGWRGSFGFNLDDIFGIVDPHTYRSFAWSRLPLILIKAIATALFVWVYVAASIKRLHDRDKSAWWMLPFFFLPGLVNQFADRLPDSHWSLLLTTSMALLYAWGFIEMGFLSGTRYPNQYGPNPLGKTQARPRSGHGTASRGGNGWDQHGALDFAPLKAGPPRA